MAKEIGFSYGMLNDDLEKQANKQGYTLGKSAEALEQLRFCLNMVRINGIVTDSQSDSMYRKLQKKVVKELREL